MIVKAQKRVASGPLGTFVLMRRGGWNRQYRTLSNGTTENISFKYIQLRPFCIKT